MRVAETLYKARGKVDPAAPRKAHATSFVRNACRSEKRETAVATRSSAVLDGIDISGKIRLDGSTSPCTGTAST